MQLNKFIDAFVPVASSSMGDRELRKRKLFIWVCFVSALYALAFIPPVVLFEYKGPLQVIFGFAIINSSLPFLFKKGVPYILVANAYLATMAVSETIIMSFSGGVAGTATDPQILVVLPIMALLFMNIRFAVFWLFIGMGIIIAFTVLQKNGVVFPITMNPDFIFVQTGLAFAGHLVLIFSIIIIFDNLKNEALNSLESKNKIIEEEKRRSDDLLLNILPYEISEELKNTGKTNAQSYDLVTVMFADFKDFTLISEKLFPEELVSGIDDYFETFDRIVAKYDIEKIKTVGDAYICAGGVPISNRTNPVDIVDAATEILVAVQAMKERRSSQGKVTFELRIGIHTGPLVAGVVGIKKFAYDIWGDTVNTAARLQENGYAGKINISGTTNELVKHRYRTTHRGRIVAKHKGEIDMYFVEEKIV